MWLQGDGDRGIQSLNFQGTGVSPWVQPRVDVSMLGLQNDVYQTMATTAFQEMRTLDPSKSSAASLLQIQQYQNLPTRSAALMLPCMLQKSTPQQTFHHGVQVNKHQSQTPSQSHLIQQQLLQQHLLDSSQQQQPFLQQQQLAGQQIPNGVSAISQYASASQSLTPPLQAISLCQQHSYSDSNGNPARSPVVSSLQSLLDSFPPDESSHLLNLPRTNPLMTSSGWPSKRAAVEPLISSGAPQCMLSQVEQLGPLQTSITPSSVSLPPFPGKECSIDRDGGTDQQNHLLFGVNIEPSSILLQNGMSSLRGVGSDSDSTTIPFSSNYMSTAGTNFSINPAMTPSNCIDESCFLQSTENVSQGNPPTRTFVKVTLHFAILINVPFLIHCCGIYRILVHLAFNF